MSETTSETSEFERDRRAALEAAEQRAMALFDAPRAKRASAGPKKRA